MYPTPGLHNLVAYCRSAAAGIEERIAARRPKQTQTDANLQAVALTWREWADELEQLMRRAGTAKGWGE